MPSVSDVIVGVWSLELRGDYTIALGVSKDLMTFFIYKKQCSNWLLAFTPVAELKTQARHYEVKLMYRYRTY